MKQTIYILILAVLFTGIAGCQKNGLLNQTPPSSLSNANYWQTPTDLQLYANSLYSIFPNYGFSNPSSPLQGPYGLDNNSDNLVPNNYDSRRNGEYTIATNGGYGPTFNNVGMWTCVYNVNYFLANYSRVTGTPAAIDPYIGEAYFFRAYLYFNGIVGYGGLPWINKPLNITDTAFLYAPRLARNIVIDSVISDMQNAINYLPAKATAATMRLYKEFAWGFLARICLFEGTWEKYHAADAFGVPGSDGSTYLQMAATYADSVINSGVFGLDNVGQYHGYWNLFNQANYAASKEVMFWMVYNAANGSGNDWAFYMITGGATGVSKSLVDDYLCADGLPTAVSPLYEGDDSVKHLVAGRDPRLAQTIHTTGDTVTDNQPGVSPLLYTLANGFPSFAGKSLQNNTTGYQLYKGLDPNYSEQNNSGGNATGNQGQIIMRYAEVLLTDAEAKAELGTIAQSDLNRTVNLLRARVNMPGITLGAIVPDPNWKFPTLSPVINEIRRERRIELACEGFRLNDILRWAAAPECIVGDQALGAQPGQFGTLSGGGVPTTLVNGYIHFYTAAQVTGGYHFRVNTDYLLPIQQQQITLNPKITQNPGSWQ